MIIPVTFLPVAVENESSHGRESIVKVGMFVPHHGSFVRPPEELHYNPPWSVEPD